MDDAETDEYGFHSSTNSSIKLSLYFTFYFALLFVSEALGTTLAAKTFLVSKLVKS